MSMVCCGGLVLPNIWHVRAAIWITLFIKNTAMLRDGARAVAKRISPYLLQQAMLNYSEMDNNHQDHFPLKGFYYTILSRSH